MPQIPLKVRLLQDSEDSGRKTGNPIRCLALVVDLVVVVDVVVSLVFKLHRGDVLSCWTHLGIRLKGLEFEASSM